MNNEKMARHIHTLMEQGLQEQDEPTRRRLKQARHAALAQLDKPGLAWRLPALGAAVAGLLLAVLLLPGVTGGPDASDLLILAPEDLEMLSTIEPEELEALDFYYWVDAEYGEV